MQFFEGSGSQNTSGAMGYQVIYASSTTYKVNLTLSASAQGMTESISFLMWMLKDGTILATYAFPKSVVAVQHNYFVGLSLQTEDGSKQGSANGGVALRRVGDIPQLMTMNVVIVGHRIVSRQRLRTYG
jgi:hypothetical protein